MVNFNGGLLKDQTTFLDQDNRGLRYGDSLFETIRVVHGKIYFWEKHYLRLMAAMRVLRMEIPMSFTMEFLEGQILQTLEANELMKAPARVRLTVFRKSGGFYTPESRDVDYIIEASASESPFYTLDTEPCLVDLFKDFYVNADMLSTLKTNNRIINVVGGIYAQENGYQNCLLLNTQKEVVEALNGNLFLVKDTTIKTPPLASGCINGVLRKTLIEIIGKMEGYTLEEAPISPFELQKADELFVTNAILGIRPITQYRKKSFGNQVARELLGKLNAVARLSD